MKRTNKKGFTIVELVVVIAVIAILAAIMIPTFSGVTTNATKAAEKADANAAYTQYQVAQSNAGEEAEKNVVIMIHDDTDNNKDKYVAFVNGALKLNGDNAQIYKTKAAAEDAFGDDLCIAADETNGVFEVVTHNSTSSETCKNCKVTNQ